MASAIPYTILVEAIAALAFFGILAASHRFPRGRAAAWWTAFWLLRGIAAWWVPMQGAGSITWLGYAAFQAGSGALLALVVIRFGAPSQGVLPPGDRDALTGLLNRSALERLLDAPLPGPGVVVVCDLDRFKALNDTHGHLVGDEVLQAAGALIAASIRREDMAFRWGGDEFVLCFGSADEEIVGSRMRGLEDRLAHFHVRTRQILPVEISWGLFRYQGGPLRDAIKQADLLMYESKRARQGGAPVGPSGGNPA